MGEERMYAMSDHNAEKIGEGIDEERQRILNQEFYIVISLKSENELVVSSIYESKELAEKREAELSNYGIWTNIYTRRITK